MEHAGQQFAGDLVHIGDHQQQSLGSGVGSGQRAGIQRAVHRACRAGFRLHLLDLHRSAEDILLPRRGPLVHEVCHGAGRRDGIDGRYFGERVGHVRRGVIAIHRFQFSFDF